MTVFNYRQRNNIVLIIIIVLGCFIIYSLRTIAGSLLSTVIMYTLFRPVFLYLTEIRGWKRIIACLSIVFGSFIIIILPFLALISLVVNKITEFQRDPFTIRVMIKKIDEFAGDKLSQPDFLDQLMDKFGGYLGEVLPSLISGGVQTILGIIVMYFLLYFMFIRHEDFENGLLRYSPFSQQNALKFATELKNITYANILGQGFIAFVQGSLVSIGFFVFDIPDAVFWGVIAMFFSFLPIVGPAFVFIPASVIELVNGNNFAGIGILLWGIVLVGNIDNVIRFLLAKRIGNTHPIITVIGVIIGIPVFGIMGLVFGPLLLSYFMLTVRIYETSRLATERLERIRSADDE
jgi:predicted PurR-regulated permease PerM